jgi:hypothetical protein
VAGGHGEGGRKQETAAPNPKTPAVSSPFHSHQQAPEGKIHTDSFFVCLSPMEVF